MYRIEYNLQSYGYKNSLANGLGTFTAVMPSHPVKQVICIDYITKYNSTVCSDGGDVDWGP